MSIAQFERTPWKIPALILAMSASASAVVAVQQKAAPGKFQLPAEPSDYAPLPGYAAMDIPEENPMTLEKAELGRQLFFDPRLSGDGKLSCYSCHLNEKGLSDGRPVAIGAFDKKLTRNSPSLWNIGFHTLYYWDGRSDTLEKQAVAAWKGGNMGAAEPEKIVATLNTLTAYQAPFQQVFKGPATVDNVGQALATYMRTIISRSTAFDRFKAGDANAMTPAAKRGYDLFVNKAKCEKCHAGLLLTDQVFHNVGVGMKAETFDEGRFKVSKNDKDKGAFKTPSLRDVTDSAPYFHDGSIATLEEAVRFMVNGGFDNPYLDRENLQKAELSDAEIADLIEFLKALDEPSTLLPPTIQ